jgi:hypothetical protein
MVQLRLMFEGKTEEIFERLPQGVKEKLQTGKAFGIGNND